MLTLNQLITAATALPDADKRILIEKLLESLPKDQHPSIDSEGHSVSPRRPILPGTLTGLLGIAKRSGPAPSDEELQAEYTDYLIQKYQ